MLRLPPILCMYATQSCINIPCLKYLKIFLFVKEQVEAAFASMAKIKAQDLHSKKLVAMEEALLKQLGELKAGLSQL